ncbi:MAG: type IX secretion system sortase PorU [Leadbetterella sp.]
MSRLLYVILILFIGSPSWAQNSTFSSGRWFKIPVSQEDVYTLNQDFFLKNKIDLTGINPKNIRVFSGPKGELPQLLDTNYPKDIKEIPIWCNDKDNKWDKEDFIKFYATAASFETHDNTFKYINHTYENVDYVYVKFDTQQAKSIISSPSSGLSNGALSEALVFQHVEKDKKNILGSGRAWFGDFFNNTYSIKQKLDQVQGPVNVKLQVMGIGRSDQTLRIRQDGQLIQEFLLPASRYNSNDAYDRYERYSNVLTTEFTVNNSNINLDFILFTPNTINAGMYFDYWEYTYKSKISTQNQKVSTYWLENQKRSAQSYLVENANNKTQVWVINQDQTPINLEVKNNVYTSPESDSDSKKVILFSSDYNSNPSQIIPLENMNLYSFPETEMLIVSSPKLEPEAKRLASHKRSIRGLNTQVISTSQIYDLMSGGKQDPTAIRNFCKFLYDKYPKAFKYLLLFGDGSYDYRNNLELAKTSIECQIPTYEARESLEPIFSFCSDDYFGFLEVGEGSWLEGYSQNGIWYSNYESDHSLDIAVGRLPLNSIIEAQKMVDKIIRFETEGKSLWKPKITMVADNRDYNIHTRNVENLQKIAQRSEGGLEFSKIYIDDFPLNANEESPQSTQKLMEDLNSGTYIVNYAGHGSESGWAQEKLLGLQDIFGFKNTIWPIFFTATCQFGKFDSPLTKSGAEISLLLPDAGAIAFLTTTRAVYSSTNEKINAAFFQNLVNYSTLGDLFRVTKNLSQSGEINRNFTLLGDPSLELLPKSKPLLETKINNLALEANPVLYTLKSNTITAKIPLNSGKIRIDVFDGPQNEKTLGTFNDGAAFEYQSQIQKIFSGDYEVRNDFLEATFILPKSKSLSNGFAQIFEQIDTNKYQYLGYIPNLKFENHPNSILYKESPQIDYKFVQANLLEIKATDDRGIYSGNESLNYVLIDDTLKIPLTSNNFQNQSKNGSFIINLEFLTAGKHQFRIIIVDVDNNTGEVSFSKEIIKTEPEISSFKIYPNPVSENLYIDIVHNKSNDNLELEMDIFSTDGKQLKNYVSTCVDCLSPWKLGINVNSILPNKGEHIYTLRVKSPSSGYSQLKVGKIIVLK